MTMESKFDLKLPAEVEAKELSAEKKLEARALLEQAVGAFVRKSNESLGQFISLLERAEAARLPKEQIEQFKTAFGENLRQLEEAFSRFVAEAAQTRSDYDDYRGAAKEFGASAIQGQIDAAETALLVSREIIRLLEESRGKVAEGLKRADLKLLEIEKEQEACAGRQRERTELREKLKPAEISGEILYDAAHMLAGEDFKDVVVDELRGLSRIFDLIEARAPEAQITERVNSALNFDASALVAEYRAYLQKENATNPDELPFAIGEKRTALKSKQETLARVKGKLPEATLKEFQASIAVMEQEIETLLSNHFQDKRATYKNALADRAEKMVEEKYGAELFDELLLERDLTPEAIKDALARAIGTERFSLEMIHGLPEDITKKIVAAIPLASLAQLEHAQPITERGRLTGWSPICLSRIYQDRYTRESGRWIPAQRLDSTTSFNLTQRGLGLVRSRGHLDSFVRACDGVMVVSKESSGLKIKGREVLATAQDEMTKAKKAAELVIQETEGKIDLQMATPLEVEGTDYRVHHDLPAGKLKMLSLLDRLLNNEQPDYSNFSWPREVANVIQDLRAQLSRLVGGHSWEDRSYTSGDWFFHSGEIREARRKQLEEQVLAGIFPQYQNPVGYEESRKKIEGQLRAFEDKRVASPMVRYQEINNLILELEAAQRPTPEMVAARRDRLIKFLERLTALEKKNQEGGRSDEIEDRQLEMKLKKLEEVDKLWRDFHSQWQKKASCNFYKPAVKMEHSVAAAFFGTVTIPLLPDPEIIDRIAAGENMDIHDRVGRVNEWEFWRSAVAAGDCYWTVSSKEASGSTKIVVPEKYRALLEAVPAGGSLKEKLDELKTQLQDRRRELKTALKSRNEIREYIDKKRRELGPRVGN
jgi:hypothetical protein